MGQNFTAGVRTGIPFVTTCIGTYIGERKEAT